MKALAAAKAEAGAFEDAVKYQKMALEFPDDDRANVERSRTRLKLCENQKPYRVD